MGDATNVQYVFSGLARNEFDEFDEPSGRRTVGFSFTGTLVTDPERVSAFRVTRDRAFRVMRAAAGDPHLNNTITRLTEPVPGVFSAKDLLRRPSVFELAMNPAKKKMRYLDPVRAELVRLGGGEEPGEALGKVWDSQVDSQSHTPRAMTSHFREGTEMAIL